MTNVGKFIAFVTASFLALFLLIWQTYVAVYLWNLFVPLIIGDLNMSIPKMAGGILLCLSVINIIACYSPWFSSDLDTDEKVVYTMLAGGLLSLVYLFAGTSLYNLL